MKEYKRRIFDEILQEELAGAGAVLIEGAKWCGKTTTADFVGVAGIFGRGQSSGAVQWAGHYRGEICVS